MFSAALLAAYAAKPSSCFRKLVAEPESEEMKVRLRMRGR
jgi:hypothetical protein